MRPGFNEFHSQMGGKPYTPDFNERLESIIRNKKLPSEKRFWAWVLRTSWGNWSPYCCRLPDKNGETQPLLQADAAEALGLSPTRISRLTTAARKAGELQADPAGRIVPTINPKEVVTVDPPANQRWAAVEQRWRNDFPHRARREDEVDAAMELLRTEKKDLKKEKLRYFKHVTSSRNGSPAPATGGLFDSGHEPRTIPRNDLLPTPVTASEPSAAPSLDSRGRPTSNIKQEETSLVSEWSKESLARDLSHSLTEIEQAVVQAYGAPLQANDPIPAQLLAEAQKLDLPVGGLCRWIQDFTKKKRAIDYKISSPTLFVKAAEKDLALWCRNHPEVVHKYQFQRDIQARERQAAVEILQDPAAAEEEKQWARQALGIVETKGASS